MKDTTAMNSIVRAEIQKRLASVERDYDVKILFAVESGSRAWGFASPNSDYDVRFVYKHHPEWYQSLYLEDQRNVIECKIVDDIDMSGWDIRKALKLYGTSNPSFVEWIHSPYVYADDGYLLSEARALVSTLYSPASGYYHYKSMASSNLRNYLSANQVKLKKYLYVIRALLARKFVAMNAVPPPLPILDLLSLLDDQEGVKEEVINLINRKCSSDELTFGDHIEKLDDYIGSEIHKEYDVSALHKTSAAPALLNQLYRSIAYENNQQIPLHSSRI